MTSRITIGLESVERYALNELARRNLRDIRQQALYIIRCELERQGMLPIQKEADDDASQS